MKELSLNILDIAENSVSAGADTVAISIEETQDALTLTVTDNGRGMTEDTLQKATDPFYTTRTTRKVGLGLPFLKLAAEQTGGYMEISSKTAQSSPGDHGTRLSALFYKNHMDFTPLGDVVATVVTLISGAPDLRFLYVHKTPLLTVRLDTDEIREALGPDIPLSEPEVIIWIRGWLQGQYGLPES